MRVLAFAAAVLLCGCPNRPCSIDPVHPFSAIGTIECPEDQLCLRGECVYACDLSSDGAKACQSADDCDDSFAFCKNGHCTSCPEGTSCVPAIGVCRPIEEPVVPEPNACATNPGNCQLPTGQSYPLDGGYEYEGIDLGVPDIGGGPPVALPPTHAGYLSVSRRIGFDGGPSPPNDEVRFAIYDLLGLDPEGRRWRVDVDPPRLAEPLPDGGIFVPLPQCVIQELSAPTIDPEPLDFASVTVATATVPPGTVYSATLAFDLGMLRYTASPVPPQICDPSTLLTRSNQLTVGGPGRISLGGAWPAVEQLHHVPFNLVLSASTAIALGQGIEVGPSPEDFTVRFLPYRCRSPLDCEVNAANVGGDSVRLTVRADSVELRCELIESPVTPAEIVVPAAVLSAFRDRVGASGDYPLVLERVNRAQLQMPPSPDTRIDMIVAVSNTHESQLRLR